jgi:PPIC-type PPIASE domain
VILKVGNTQVTQADFEAHISDIEPQGDAEEEGAADKDADKDKDRRKQGDDYASVLILSQQAVAEHLDSSPEISRKLAIARMQILSDAEFAGLLRQTQPTREEISQYYAAHLSDYDEVRVRRLFIWKTGGGSKNSHGLSAQDARARAEAILQASAAGLDAQKLAQAFKDSGNGLFDADPIVFPRGELPPKMEKVAFALKAGQWGEVEDTADSVILLQLVQHGRQSLGEVSSLIERRLQGQKVQAKLSNLKKNAGIWMDEKYFGTAVAPVPGAQRRDSDPPSTLRKTEKKGESNNDEPQK